MISSESGADHPERSPSVFRNTALDATYNCASIQRLICVNLSKVNDVLFRSVSPEKRDVVLVIVNDTEYGGSGGAVAVASIHTDVVELILHEMGHSFGLLADEYGGPPPPFCDSSVEPPEANATKQTVREQIKWNPWINLATPIPTLGTQAGVPGLYAGAKYCDTGLSRPTFNSKMRSLSVPFEQINSEQLIKRIYNWVSPIDSVDPFSSAIILKQRSNQIFRVHTPQPLTHSLQMTWKLDGQSIGNGTEIIPSSSGLALGSHNIEVLVSDPTSSVRSDPAGLLSESETWNLTVIAADRPPADFDSDFKNDVGVYQTSSGNWFFIRSTSGFGQQLSFGGSNFLPVTGDYDGDGRADTAVYGTATGNWFVVGTTAGFFTPALNFGGTGFIPVPGDYDGDGKTDAAVYQSSSGNWFIRQSGGGFRTIPSFGGVGFVPVPGDYDGDGKIDVAAYQITTGNWFVVGSASGFFTPALNFGGAGFIPVPGDYDGDGRIDSAVYRTVNGNWFTVGSTSGFLQILGFGGSGYIPVPGDYDGDGETDAAVYQGSTGNWFVVGSTSGFFTPALSFGGAGFVPVLPQVTILRAMGLL